MGLGGAGLGALSEGSGTTGVHVSTGAATGGFGVGRGAVEAGFGGAFGNGSVAGGGSVAGAALSITAGTAGSLGGVSCTGTVMGSSLAEGAAGRAPEARPSTSQVTQTAVVRHTPKAAPRVTGRGIEGFFRFRTAGGTDRELSRCAGGGLGSRTERGPGSGMMKVPRSVVGARRSVEAC